MIFFLRPEDVLKTSVLAGNAYICDLVDDIEDLDIASFADDYSLFLLIRNDICCWVAQRWY